MTIEAELAEKSISNWDVKILATDIDTEVLARAKSGRYDRADLDVMPNAYRDQGFVEVDDRLDKMGGQMDIRPALRRLVVFKPLNLHGPWPFNGPFDIIFCRNVVIYFDRPTQRVLFNRMADVLADGGYLYCGHSESLHGITTRFEPVGRSVYEKLR